MLFDVFHGQFDNYPFGHEIAVIIRIQSGIDRHKIIGHDTSAAVNGTS